MHNKLEARLANATEASNQIRARQIRRVVSRDGYRRLAVCKGDELKMLQEEAIDRATRLPKITIHNKTEVIDSVPTANEMGGVTHPWTTVAIDCARMQSYLPKGESMPGTALIEEYFPHTQISAKKTRKVRVAHEVLICQHVAASAQQLHWD